MSIRVPRKEDGREMAHVLYEGLHPLRYFSILWPGAQRDNWIEVQADYCIQHLGERHSVAFITVDDKGAMTGMAYGRFLDAETLPASTGLTLIGCDDVELGKLENQTLHKALIEKYGRVLWINMMSVLPKHQGKGLGSMLMEALMGEARARDTNVGLAGAQGKFEYQRREHASRPD